MSRKPEMSFVYREKLYIYHRVFRYRQTPVPYTGRCWRYTTPHKGIHRTIQHAENIRPKARVPFYYYEKMRHTDRSWKSSTKCRKQWEKHLDRKGVYYDK